MYKALSPHAIHVRPANLDEALRYARKGGFEGLEVNASEVADLVEAHGAADVRRRFAEARVRVAGWGLGFDWRGAKDPWQQGIEQLPRITQAAVAIGATRAFTWVWPSSDERPYEENWGFHVERLAPIARVLDEHGCRFGLEFIGPKTMRAAARYPFVYRLEEMLKLGAAIHPRVGLLLDCWHWHTSGGTVEAIRALNPAQVVYVHVNDAPRGIAVDAQIDTVRALPGETGVIDISGFLQALAAIGYDGPVVPEPFKQELANLPSDEARLEVVGAAMDAIFKDAQLG